MALILVINLAADETIGTEESAGQASFGAGRW